MANGTNGTNGTPNGTPRVVIVGGGSAGVFTAFLLAKHKPDDLELEIHIFEEAPEVGGHANSDLFGVGAGQVNIDTGAQFFSEGSQPDYLKMLKEEGLFEPHIFETNMGVTLWDKTDEKLLFRIPDNLFGILFANPLSNVVTWLCFLATVGKARDFFEDNDWAKTFGEWIKELKFWFTTDEEEETFQNEIFRPLMYQFGLVPPDQLDGLSARFVLFYFLGSWPTGLDITPFSVFQSKIGLDGIHRELLKKYGLNGDDVLHTDSLVKSVEKCGDGYIVKTAGGDSYPADELVFATNPKRTRELLSESEFPDLCALLDEMDYLKVPICIQETDTPAYMPSDATAWSGANVLVLDKDGGSDGPTHYMLSIWFGPLRDESAGAKYFKSWGSPALEPSGVSSEVDRTHHLMVGTPEFIAARDALRKNFHGKKHMWFTGGYSIDYDTQNSSYRSAGLAVDEMLAGYGAEPTVLQLLKGDVAARLPKRFALADAIEQSIRVFAPNHPATRAFVRGPSPPSDDAAAR